MRTKILLIVLVFSLALVPLGPTSRAQDPAPAPPPPTGPIIGLSMIVTDKDGKGVNTIRKDQIRVFEEGNEQTVLAIEADERPVDCVLLIDASGSFKTLIVSALEAAKLFIVNRRPDDQIAVARFVSSDIIEDTQPFTTDNTLLLKALDSIYLQYGQSAVVDALYLAADYVTKHNKENEGRRKVVVLISDGEDRNSYYKPEQLTKLLRETGVQVFILGLVSELDKEGGMLRISPRERAEKLLTNVADETGGRVFFPATKKALTDAAAQIILDMRAQFRIKYQSTNDASKKGFRKVDVKYVAAPGDEKRNLITPRGYFVGPRTPPDKKRRRRKNHDREIRLKSFSLLDLRKRETHFKRNLKMNTRRNFLSLAGKGVGLAALSVPAIGALTKEIEAATERVRHLSPEQAAMDEDYWSVIQNSFTVTRGIVNLNNGGVSPSPRIVTEALVRYIWQQEDATAYTMWQILEPQSETIRTGLAELFGCDREEIAITRNASESLEICLMGMDFKRGDEILSTTQDYPRMLTTLRQREKREGLVLKLVQIPIPPKDVSEITAAFERGITSRTKLILVSHQVNITGQITPVKAICDMARARGIETIVDGAHSFAQFDFKQKDLGCDYFGTSLHKWLYAPKGSGLLFVKRDKIEKLWPLMASEPKQVSDIRKFEEIGTHSAAPRLAIGEAMLFHNGMGGKRKEARLRYLSRYWMNRLKDVPKIGFNTSFDPNQSCAIANVKIEGLDPVAIGNYLFTKHRIFTTPIVHEEFKGIRITPNVYTTLAELDRFCDLMEKIASKGLPT